MDANEKVIEEGLEKLSSRTGTWDTVLEVFRALGAARRKRKARVKFICSTVGTVREDSGVSHIHFYPVYHGCEENERFFAATPGGAIELAVVRREAASFFQPGKSYYVDFTEAP
jgi:hypothetical protein